MTERSRELEALIREARGADLPSAERLARVRARVVPPSPPGDGGGGSDGGSGGSGVVGSSGGGALSSSALGWIGPFVAGAAVVAASAVYWEVRAPELRPATAAEADVEPVAPPSAAGTAAEPAAADAERAPEPPRGAEAHEPPRGAAAERGLAAEHARGSVPAQRTTPRRAAQARAARPRPQPSAAAGETANTFREEVALLEAAILAHRRGELEHARRLVAEHSARFPASQLSAERARLQAALERR